jgi:hypothetical protein
MPGLFVICTRAAIAAVGCAVLFCAVNGPGAAQHAAQYQQQTTIVVANVANPAKKGDRLPMTSAVKAGAGTPSFYTKSSSRHPPVGCDPMFSPIADPAHASLYGRCMT